MRTITNKAVQVHFECVCGYNSVYTETYPIKWKDLKKSGIIRKKDIKTGEPFLLLKQFSKECHCSIEEIKDSSGVERPNDRLKGVISSIQKPIKELKKDSFDKTSFIIPLD